MADIPHRTKRPPKSIGFKPLPESLKPSHRRGHRVHVKKTQLDGELLPDHAEAKNTRGDKGFFYRACNGGVDYDRTIPYIPSNMNENKADIRSRAESPRRARAAREKYWSYRVINPDSQRDLLHLDFDPPKDKDGNPRSWARLGILPCHAPVIKPSKRELFSEAQKWPRPPRKHRAFSHTPKGVSNPRRTVEWRLACASDEWNVSGSKFRPRKYTPESPMPDEGYFAHLPDVIFSDALEDCDDEYHAAVIAQIKRAGLDEWFLQQDEVAGIASKTESDVDALFELAEQKYALQMAKKRKKLLKEGWDVWEPDSVMSPKSKADWVETDDELTDWELTEAV